MSTHRIEPERSTLHGHFSRDLPPVLAIESGDTVRYRTLDAGWGLEGRVSPGVERRRFEPRTEQLDSGHALCGPVAINAARPGMTLEIAINELRPGDYGWTVAGVGRARSTSAWAWPRMRPT